VSSASWRSLGSAAQLHQKGSLASTCLARADTMVPVPLALGLSAPRRPQAPTRWLSGLSSVSNISFGTFSSFDADDELSSASDMTNDDESFTADAMVDALSDSSVSRRYPGEDTRPTSTKELMGWYAYGFAAETYIICGAFDPSRPSSIAWEAVAANFVPSYL
jgi:hypothetical protein